MFALVPVAAAAAVIAAVPYLMTPAPSPVAVASLQPPAKPPQVQARAGLSDVLEPRGTPPPSRLRTVSLRGQNVAFGEGVLEGAPADGPSKPFVLKHTDVRADLTGFVSQVTVTQEFENPFSSPVEAVYVFPLPDDAAVDEMTLIAGTRTIRATIQKRAEARRMYDEAKAQGRRAALLDQERPNIFTQSVANLMPGERVKVSLRYVAPLRYDDGQYTFNFPMTVGPRFVPGASVEDAERISPPTERSGRDVAVAVHLFAGAPVEELTSVSHRLRVTRGDGIADVTLDSADRVPNKDFILRWRVTGEAKRAAVLTTGGPGGTFALMVMPQARIVHAQPVPKEMVFVIDTSCSMAGPPLAAAKRAMRSAMEQMNPDDTFMLIDFADRASSFHDSPLPNTPPNVGRALAYLAALPASGGTNQLAGIERALSLPTRQGYLREVLLMTDGFIGNETQILAATERLLGGSRIFGFGIGSSVNHYLLSRLSQVGRGFYQYVRTDEDPEEAVERFVRRIEKPMLTDVSLEWSGVEVFDVLPRKVPDLFEAQPIVLVGRYKQPGRGVVTLRGMRNGGEEQLTVAFEIPSNGGGSPGLASLWARARVEELDMMQHAGEQPDIVRAITTLGLEHHLVTKYTSFVAVDDVRVTDTPAQLVLVGNEKPDQTQVADGTRPLQYKRLNTIQVIRGAGEAPEPTSGSDGRTTATPPPPSATPLARGYMNAPDMPAKALEPPRQPAAKPAPRPRSGDAELAGALGKDSYAARPLNGAPGTPPRGGDDEFAVAFGHGRGTASKDPAGAFKGGEVVAGQTNLPKKSVYVPPAPGSYEVAESLGQADIMEVVKSNIGAIKVCVDEQKKREPGVTGKIVMKWTVLPNGTTTLVMVASDEFKNTYLAGCLTRAIKTWKFPHHRSPGEPVVFPFKF